MASRPGRARSTPAGRTFRSTGLRRLAPVWRPPPVRCCSRQTISRARAGSFRAPSRRRSPAGLRRARPAIASRASSYFFFVVRLYLDRFCSGLGGTVRRCGRTVLELVRDGDVETVQRLQVVVARDLVHQPGARLRAGPGVVERACDQAREKHGVPLLVALLLALQRVRRLTEILERLAEVLLHLRVRREARSGLHGTVAS